MDKKTLNTLEYNEIKNKIEKFCKSKLGKSIANKLEPMIDEDEIRQSLDETYEAMSMIYKFSNPPIYEIINVKASIMHVSKGGYIVPEVLLKIGQILSSVHDIKRYAGESDENHENYPMIMAMMDSLVEEPDLVATINNAIISEDEISDNASRNLARIRQTKRQKTENIRDKINSILSSNDQALQENIVTMRDDRYVIPVKVSHKSSFKGIVHDHSSSGQTVYIEPMEVVELNNELRMLEAEEREEIIRILKEISDRVYDAKDSIFVDQDVLSRLDFIFAKAKYAIEIDATNPKLNTNGYFNFKNARHPLLDKKKVVPISIYLGDDYNTLVITGPNTGGKTVTLKTVGLITLMAQSGILIPVDENSEVAIFDNIFTDIGDEQSIEQSLSTFSAHMKNIVHIVNNITFNSLVLFDELGAGTDPTEGAALAIAILRIFLDKSIRTIATTHYSQLKIFALTERYVKNGSVEFDVNTLSPTYRLRIGIPGKSNAFEISRRLGLDDDIINNAKEILSQEDKDFEDVLSDIESEKKQIDEDKRRQLELKEDLLKLRDRYEKELEKTKLEKERIINEAKENANEIYIQAKEESRELINKLKFLEKESDARTVANDVENKFNKRIKKSSSKKLLNETSKKQNLQLGDEVEILGIDQQGTIVSEPDKKGDLLVQVGILKINANVKNLKKIKEQEVIQSSKSIKSIIKNKANSDIKSEIDLRGKNIEEAIYELDKYIDDCVIVGLKKVNIIHGKGTGMLRKGIREYLRSDKRIKKVEDAAYNEGGLGATFIYLK